MVVVMTAETSPAGEAGSSTASDDKEFSCPTCGKGFGSSQYMKVHHAHAHGESIAGVAVECDTCGTEFRRVPSSVRERNYCSNECMGKGRSERYSGENHPSYKGGKATISCEHCGGDYEVWPAQTDESRFCSIGCKSEWQSEHVSGENHHQYTSIDVECVICGKVVTRKPSHVEYVDNVFCSQGCHREYQSRHQVGENHHLYGGGRSEKYGPNWDEQAAKARERDGHKCQDCGAPQSDFDRALSVHHIMPRKKYTDENGNYDYERGNRLENLVTLCRSCHSKWEGLSLRPDTRGGD